MLTGVTDVDDIVLHYLYSMLHRDSFKPVLKQLEYNINVAKTITFGRALHDRDFKTDFFHKYFTPNFCCCHVHLADKLSQSQDDSTLLERRCVNDTYKNFRKQEMRKMRI